MEALTLWNLPLMARKSMETFNPGPWTLLTESTRESAASNDDRAGMKPHWLQLPSPSDLATRKRRDAITLSKILETSEGGRYP